MALVELKSITIIINKKSWMEVYNSNTEKLTSGKDHLWP